MHLEPTISPHPGYPPPPWVAVIMGVSGCGKSTLAAALSADSGYPWADADAFHSAEAVAKMSSGQPLEETDRLPWLNRLRSLVDSALRGRTPLFLACSALRQSYRDRLARPGEPVHFLHLHGSKEQIAALMTQRRHHFMPPLLLDSQFAILEIPDNAITLPVGQPIKNLVGLAKNLLCERRCPT